MLKIVLFQPEIAGNVGSIIRSCACFNAQLHIIEPCGFPFDINRIRKSSLDYIDHVEIFRHTNFENFFSDNINSHNRLILATTKSNIDIFDFEFNHDDFIIFGKESSGVPDYIHQIANHRITIAMLNQQRSLNIAISCGIFLSVANNNIKF